MVSQEFREALAALAADARGRTVAIMCAESVWWRCHRRLIADAAVLLHRSDVRNLFHDGHLVVHEPAWESRIVDVDGEELVVYDVGVGRPPVDDEADAPKGKARHL